MKQDIILAGVGGQGILSIAYVIDFAALDNGLQFKQAEVHGMAQRGGAVQSHLRLSHDPVFSELIPRGRADLILSVEPLETLRYIEYLKPGGTIITSINPFINIPDYPDINDIRAKIEQTPNSTLIDAAMLAGEAGSAKAQNMVMLGAASPYLILDEDSLLKFIQQLFNPKGDKIIRLNQTAFHLGRKAAG